SACFTGPIFSRTLADDHLLSDITHNFLTFFLRIFKIGGWHDCCSIMPITAPTGAAAEDAPQFTAEPL
ncbi:MAG: hypothetical protein LBV70_04955, partial [Candidatus Adiutrix sp.]|nr:hypothetical protein [Candidatus Adiutrix sp.]